jgi:hypothetical protein
MKYGRVLIFKSIPPQLYIDNKNQELIGLPKNGILSKEDVYIYQTG